MKTRKNLLREIVVAVLFIAVLSIAGYLLSKKNSAIENLNAQNSQLNMTIEERDSLVDEMAQTFDKIEDNLTFVRNKRGELVLSTNEKNVSDREQMVADIALMNEMLDKSSIEIENLTKKLNASGIEIKSFKNRIAKLNKNIKEQNENILALTAELEERDSQIAELDKKVVDLETDISITQDSLKSTAVILKSKVDELTKTENDLNRVYYASGTFNELKENGVLEKEGGFLGLGRAEVLKKDFNENYFTEIDKRNTDIFPIFSKKIEIISEHPDSSYKYIFEDDQIAYLKIEDPDEFWKASKYAVVQVKK